MPRGSFPSPPPEPTPPGLVFLGTETITNLSSVEVAIDFETYNWVRLNFILVGSADSNLSARFRRSAGDVGTTANPLFVLTTDGAVGCMDLVYIPDSGRTVASILGYKNGLVLAATPDHFDDVAAYEPGDEVSAPDGVLFSPGSGNMTGKMQLWGAGQN